MEKSRRSTVQNSRNSSVKSLTISEIEGMLAEAVADAAAVAPAKALARETGMTERHVRALRQREHFPGGAALLALAMQAPELKMIVARLLGFAPPTVEGFNETLSELKRLVASLPDGMGEGE